MRQNDSNMDIELDDDKRNVSKRYRYLFFHKMMTYAFKKLDENELYFVAKKLKYVDRFFKNRTQIHSALTMDIEDKKYLSIIFHDDLLRLTALTNKSLDNWLECR